MCERAGEVTAQTRSKSLPLGAIFRAYSKVRTYLLVRTYCICLSNYITPNRETDYGTFAKGHHSSHLSTAILLSGVQGINPPSYGSDVVSCKVEFHMADAMEVSEDLF